MIMNTYPPEINQQLVINEIDTSAEFACNEQSPKPTESITLAALPAVTIKQEDSAERSFIHREDEPNDLAVTLANSSLSATHVENNDTTLKETDSTKQNDNAPQDDGPLVYPLPNLEQLQNLEPRERLFESKLIYIHSDVGLPPETRACLTQHLEKAGAAVINNYSDTKGHDSVIYIFRYRDTNLFMEMCKQDKTVASLAWLTNTLQRGRVESPLRSIWDFPSPKGGIPGMENYVATITGYDGEARSLIFQLCTMVGLKWTPNLGSDTTHVICSSVPWFFASRQGTAKYRIGKQRNCNIINHLWLEDCYQQWKYKSLEDKRYSYFPDNGILQKLVGKTPLGAKDLEKWLNKETWPAVTSYTPAHLLRNSRPRLNEVLDFDGTLLSRGPRQAAKHASSQLRDIVIPDMNTFQQQLRSKSTPYAADITSSESIPSTPTSKKKQTKVDHSTTVPTPAEPLLPPAPPSKEHRPAPISSPLTVPRKRVKLGDKGTKVSPASSAKPTGNMRQYLPSGGQDTTPSLSTKDRKPSNPSAIDTSGTPMKLATTSYTLTKEEEKGIRNLGGKVVSDIRNADVLIVPNRILRTPKFLCAINLGVTITNVQWLQESIENKDWLDPLAYPVIDKEMEARYGFKLSNSRLHSTLGSNKRKKGDRGTWLQGYDVCVFQTGQENALKEVVESAGGKFIQIPKRRLLTKSKENTGQGMHSNTVIALTDKDAKHQRWAELQEYGIGIYDKDLAIIGSLRQRLSLDEFRLA